MSNSQVLFRDYTRNEALTVLKEMIDGQVTEMIANGYYTDHVSLYVGYSGWTSPSTGGSKKIDGGHTDSYKKIESVIERIYTTSLLEGLGSALATLHTNAAETYPYLRTLKKKSENTIYWLLYRR